MAQRELETPVLDFEVLVFSADFFRQTIARYPADETLMREKALAGGSVELAALAGGAAAPAAGCRPRRLGREIDVFNLKIWSDGRLVG